MLWKMEMLVLFLQVVAVLVISFCAVQLIINNKKKNNSNILIEKQQEQTSTDIFIPQINKDG